MRIYYFAFLLSRTGFNLVSKKLYALVKLIAILSYHLDGTPVEMKLRVQMKSLPQSFPGDGNVQVVDEILSK